MPTKNPRVNVVLEPPLFEKVKFLAERDGVSLSTKVRDLVRETVEVHEDLFLADLAEKRDKSFKKTRALTHDEVWT